MNLFEIFTVSDSQLSLRFGAKTTMLRAFTNLSQPFHPIAPNALKLVRTCRKEWLTTMSSSSNAFKMSATTTSQWACPNCRLRKYVCICMWPLCECVGRARAEPKATLGWILMREMCEIRARERVSIARAFEFRADFVIFKAVGRVFLCN